jgi:hypothetical protein
MAKTSARLASRSSGWRSGGCFRFLRSPSNSSIGRPRRDYGLNQFSDFAGLYPESNGGIGLERSSTSDL